MGAWMTEPALISAKASDTKICWTHDTRVSCKTTAVLPVHVHLRTLVIALELSLGSTSAEEL